MGIYSRFLMGSAAGTIKVETAPAAAQRVSMALAALRAHVMLADENNVIVSMNPSVERMLRGAEQDIRKELPDFAVDRLLGSSMDLFHRHPERQRQVLAQLSSPHEATVRIGGREFSLLATPLFEAGTRVGTVVEWQDLTETRALRKRELDQQRAEQIKNEELGVITAALDSVSSNVMMADNEGRIFFANKAVLKLLKNAEDDVRRVLPGFSVDGLVGRNFDSFHAHPAHQRNLLGSLTGPHEADIKVGVRRFRLTAAPVSGKDGKRLATVVEWQDRTAELQMEGDVEHAISAAIRGDLDARIDNRAYHGFLGKVAGGINQLLDAFDTVLKDTGASLHALAKGDLRKKIERAYAGRYDLLKTDLNGTVDKLCSVVRDINAATGEVKHISHELSVGNMSLSQRTEQQAASLEETSAAMEELTRTVEQNTSNAGVARDLSHDARNAAEEGGRVLGQAIVAMNAISESSRRIDEIIGVIDGIAFQTNLLALNAAVEAARAGDQGRGFGVVAAEVRNLAGMSAKAAKEIKELIRDSGGKVQEGTALVNKSGDTLAHIIQSVKKVNDIVNEIASSSADQAKGLNEINRAVQEMDATTQQNAAMVEQASAASESLYQRAESLDALMRFFDTGRHAS
jgi:methyl-accepting chemotaxis protein